MTTTTTIPRRPSVRVGQRVELARYTVPAGERVIWGQRVAGVVSFLPGRRVVLGWALSGTEDSTCRSRTALRTSGDRTAAPRGRPNGLGESCGVTACEREERS
jgi:hypothetical protein